MIVEDIDLRVGPSLPPQRHPMVCEHFWEADGETSRAYCSCCGTRAYWVNDPRVEEGVSV